MVSIPLTEKKIPAGFTPQDLGEVGVVSFPSMVTQGCYLISYLTSPLPIYRRNTYVVIVQDDTLYNKINSIEWIVTIESMLPNETVLTDFRDRCICEFAPDVLFPITMKVVLRDVDNNILRELRISQQVKSLHAPLERLLQYSEYQDELEIRTYNSAIGLHQDTSREIINDLLPYINESYDRVAATNKFPKELFLTVLYLQCFSVVKHKIDDHTIFAISSRFRDEEIKNVGKILNGQRDFYPFQNEDENIGISQLSASTVAMVTDDPNKATAAVRTYTEWRLLPGDSRPYTVLENIKKDFSQLQPGTKADLFNLLRFPKSNINLCYGYLCKLKNRPDRFSGVSENEFRNSADQQQLILTEFFEGANQLANYSKIHPFAKDVFRMREAPFIKLTLAENFGIVVTGTVVDQLDNGKSMMDAQVDVYANFLTVITNGLKCYRNIENIVTAPPTEWIQLSTGEKLHVLEVRRNIVQYPNTEIARVIKASNKLVHNEGWVVYRSGNSFYADLVSEKITTVTVDSQNNFRLSVNQYAPCFIRVVKPPTGVDGYFDGELQEIVPGLPQGWFHPPRTNLRIEMVPAKHMVKESVLTALLSDWVSYAYAYDYKPNFPAGYLLDGFTSDNDGILRFNQKTEKEIACNTFVQALITEAWRNFADENGESFYWSWSHNLRSGNDDALQLGSHPWSAVNIYCKEWIINILENPQQDFTISIDDQTLHVVHGSNRTNTASNIVTAINSNPELSQKFSAWSRGVAHYAFIVISARDKINFYDININVSRPKNEIRIASKIWSAIPLNINNPNVFPPPWTILQGWHTWNPADNELGGHNLFVVDVHKPTGKMLTLEAGYTDASKLKGPGFRTMGIRNDSGALVTDINSGDIDNHLVGGNIDPNKDLHWSHKVNVKWTEYWNSNKVYMNTMGLARLKLYDLQWSKPLL